MRKLRLACMASLLATGMAQAATPCNGFEIKIKNRLADDLFVTKVALEGADLQPNGIQRIEAKTEQVFTVNKSTKDMLMVGSFVFNTISLPSRVVKINFDLKNEKIFCEHNDRSPESDYSVEKTRLPGKVDYTISNK